MSRTSLSFFLLVVSFGILFAGCSAPPDAGMEDITFTDQDLARVHELAQRQESGSGTALTASGVSVLSETTLDTSAPNLSVSNAVTSVTLVQEGTAGSVAVDREKQERYDAIRIIVVDAGGNLYRVNNAFLNVRATMDTGSSQIARLKQGDVLTVLDIPSAAWAKVKLQSGMEGFVSFRYIAKLTTEEKLAAEKKKFEGQYFVDFAFLNVRREPSTQAEKIGELPGQAIIRPIAMNGEWAKVSLSGKEGFVSAQYLKPFLPTFLVRQDSYALPILQFRAQDTAAIQSLPKHIAFLKKDGRRIVTLRSLYDVVLAQESRDARVNPDMVALVVTGVNARNWRVVSDALQAAGVSATLFLQTKDLGLNGITEKMVLTVLANGNDVQSAGHTGDDLRTMTDAQVQLELRQSKKLLEDITQKEVYAISYPRGGVNDRVMDAVAASAYLFGLTEVPDSRFARSQFLRLPSTVVTDTMSSDDVLNVVKK